MAIPSQFTQEQIDDIIARLVALGATESGANHDGTVAIMAVVMAVVKCMKDAGLI